MDMFTAGVDQDKITAVRRSVAARLVEILADSTGEGVERFTVVRTNNRKGNRDERRFRNESPYQGDPMVRVTVQLELTDRELGSALVDQVAELEDDEDNAKLRAEIEQAERDAAEAQNRLVAAKSRLEKGGNR